MSIDVDQIAAGISKKQVDRRSIAKGAAWSLPVIAAGVAAPAFAASPNTCDSCNRQQQCILTVGNSGNCKCAPGLLCVGTGPLGLANVCVGSTLVASTCGKGTCFGVCLSVGSPLVTALNGIIGLITTLLNGLNIVGAIRTTTIAQIPKNVCVSPLGDGSLGTLCRVSTSEGGLLGNTILDALVAVFNTLVGTLNLAGVTLGTNCNAGLTCNPIVGERVRVRVPIIGTKLADVTVAIGTCECTAQRAGGVEKEVTNAATERELKHAQLTGEPFIARAGDKTVAVPMAGSVKPSSTSSTTSPSLPTTAPSPTSAPTSKPAPSTSSTSAPSSTGTN